MNHVSVQAVPYSRSFITSIVVGNDIIPRYILWWFIKMVFIVILDYGLRVLKPLVREFWTAFKQQKFQRLVIVKYMSSWLHDLLHCSIVFSWIAFSICSAAAEATCNKGRECSLPLKWLLTKMMILLKIMMPIMKRFIIIGCELEEFVHIVTITILGWYIWCGCWC